MTDLPPELTEKFPPEIVQIHPVWVIYELSKGKLFYYNPLTRQSVWEKPSELKNEVEKEIEDCIWKEYFDDRSNQFYYYNNQTKICTWECPKELKELKEKLAHVNPDETIFSFPVILDFQTRKHAEEAFTRMLEETGITYAWKWEDVIRKVYNHPFYKALKSFQEKKELWDRYTRDMKAREIESKEKKMEADLKALKRLFSSSKEITGTTTFVQAKRLFENHPDWENATKQHRKMAFRDYTEDLYNQEKETMREVRKINMANLKLKLESISSITLKTTWKEFQEIFNTDPIFQSDEHMLHMDTLDRLLCFDEHISRLDAIDRQARGARIRKVRRRERIARDGFKELLREKKEAGFLHARTKWKEFYPLIKDDARYDAMLGTSGSSPLELFWDALMGMEEEYRSNKNAIIDFLEDNKIDIKHTMTVEGFIEEFGKSLQGKVKPIYLQVVIRDFIHRAQKDERRHQEKKVRKKMDALRALLKHLDSPPVLVSDTYEIIRPRIENTPEFLDLDEVSRVEAFAKFMTRLKEKMAHKEKDDVSDGAIEEDEEVEEEERKKKRASSGRSTDRSSKRKSSHRHSHSQDLSEHKEKRPKKEEDVSDEEAEEGELR